jgi:hypothetical protein
LKPLLGKAFGINNNSLLIMSSESAIPPSAFLIESPLEERSALVISSQPKKSTQGQAKCTVCSPSTTVALTLCFTCALLTPHGIVAKVRDDFKEACRVSEKISIPQAECVINLLTVQYEVQDRLDKCRVAGIDGTVGW